MDLDEKTQIAIIGAGIMGLSAGVELLKQGYSVTVYTDNIEQTASLTAGAIWMPYNSEPWERVKDWAIQSLAHYTELAKNSETGVHWINHTEFFNAPQDIPEWMTLAEKGCMPQVNLITPYYYSIKIPAIDTEKYMAWLRTQFLTLGGKILLKKIIAFSDISCGTIVNCSGVGARELCQDYSTYPIKGQTFRLTQPLHFITESILHISPEDSLLVLPHADSVVIGVTYYENDCSLDYDHKAEKQLLMRANTLFPGIADGKILSRKVSARPGRKGGIRLDTQWIEGKQVIHNYGHAGGGITLAPGCTKEVLMHVKEIFQK